MKSFFKIVVAVLCFLLLGNLVGAQNDIRRESPVSTECGNIIEGEFTTNFQEQTYIINLRAGSELNVSVQPLGEHLFTAILITGPTNLGVALSNGEIGHASMFWDTVEREPKASTSTLGASGNYTIRVVNFSVNWINPYTYATDSYRYTSATGGIGAYTLFVGCTLRDGTVINAGDVLPTPIPPPQPTPAGSELAPITLPGAAVIPLTSGIVSGGSIGAEGIPPYTYTFTAAPGNTLTLQVDRTSGNLNLGIVVISPTSEVLFYGGLIASNTLSTTLTLPSEGQYTIGVFRVDLVPPAAPEATAFQVLGTLNP